MPETVRLQVARLLEEEREKRHISLNLLAPKAGVSRFTTFAGSGPNQELERRWLVKTRFETMKKEGTK